MMNESPLRIKSFLLGVKIVKLSRRISMEQHEYVLTRQLLRSGTSPGAMIREAQNAESTKDFIHKLKIALKETGETEYWLDLFLESKLMSTNEYKDVYNLCVEVGKMLTSSIKTAKMKLES